VLGIFQFVQTMDWQWCEKLLTWGHILSGWHPFIHVFRRCCGSWNCLIVYVVDMRSDRVIDVNAGFMISVVNWIHNLTPFTKYTGGNRACISMHHIVDFVLYYIGPIADFCGSCTLVYRWRLTIRRRMSWQQETWNCKNQMTHLTAFDVR
jgi:hypothetical protein